MMLEVCGICDESIYCDKHQNVTDDENTLGDPWADMEYARKECSKCRMHYSIMTNDIIIGVAHVSHFGPLIEYTLQPYD